MWMLVEVSFDRSESQKPMRTSALFSVPRTPNTIRAALNGNRNTNAEEFHNSGEAVTDPPPL